VKRQYFRRIDHLHLYAGVLLTVNPEDEGDMFLQNVGFHG
jgi:hypothetical protein